MESIIKNRSFQKDLINSEIKRNPTDFIKKCEAAYTSQLEVISGEILKKQGRSLVMLAGPSSSGKTTSAGLLKEILENEGRSVSVISLDDFYRDQDKSYYFEDGTVDYETVKAIEVPLVEHCLNELEEKGETFLPRFSFKEKKRSGFERVIVSPDEILIVEGLHALNDEITKNLNKEKLTKLYVSVSSRIADGDNVLFSKRDLRFIRRLIRDFHFRSSQVDYTYYLWNGVRMGEDRYLFPFKDNADFKIDSIHPYELCLFKNEAIRLLSELEEESRYYENARSLIEKLEGFEAIDPVSIPEASLLREFIG